MGNQESLHNQQTLHVSPVVTKLRNTLHLNITINKTTSFVNEEFTSQIKKTAGFISRINNPFCPMTFSDSKDHQQEWFSCCLISPLMAIASPRVICDQKGKYVKNIKILAVTKKQSNVQIPVKDTIIIKQGSVCILLLSKPIIELGWAGVICLDNRQEIQNQPYKIINHPKSELDSEKDLLTYHQQITKAFYKKEKDFIGSYKSMPGSLIFKVIDKKPYIVGVQINEKQGQFITKSMLKKINQIATKLINTKIERQILTAIDIQHFQLMEKL